MLLVFVPVWRHVHELSHWQCLGWDVFGLITISRSLSHSIEIAWIGNISPLTSGTFCLLSADQRLRLRCVLYTSSPCSIQVFCIQLCLCCQWVCNSSWSHVSSGLDVDACCSCSCFCPHILMSVVWQVSSPFCLLYVHVVSDPESQSPSVKCSSSWGNIPPCRLCDWCACVKTLYLDNPRVMKH